MSPQPIISPTFPDIISPRRGGGMAFFVYHIRTRERVFGKLEISHFLPFRIAAAPLMESMNEIAGRAAIFKKKSFRTHARLPFK